MAFSHGPARCWTSRARKWRESAAERVCRLGQSLSQGPFFICLKRWLPFAPSVLFLMLDFSEVAHFISPHTLLPKLRTVKMLKVVLKTEFLGECKVSVAVSLCLFSSDVHVYLCRVEEAYRRISGPACVTVDASPSADQVLRQVQLLIRGKCHL